MSDDRPPTPGPGECWECPIRDGRYVCDPAVSLRCPHDITGMLRSHRAEANRDMLGDD